LYRASNQKAAVVKESNRRPVRPYLKTLFGILICAWSAALMSFIFHGQNSRFILPVVFLGIVFLVSNRYGVSAGLLGSAVAALIFAMFLYAPLGSPAIANKAARSTLAWLVLGGLTISYLLGSSPGGHQRHN
jgi:K+-sensing histidine kinase KdpD